MKLIKPKAELLPWSPGIEGVYKMIELAGRTCYRSEDKITEDSAKPFVDRMIASKHTAMLEHGTVYLIGKDELSKSILIAHYSENKYSKLRVIPDNNRGIANYVVTTNLRVLVENNLLDDLQYLCDPTEFHEMRYTFRLTTDRGVSHELVRHRKMSFAQESQRYCNYFKNKFGSGITFIKPDWFCALIDTFEPNKEMHRILQKEEYSFCSTLFEAEIVYKFLLKRGLSPQEARAVLPNATKTEIVVTGFASDFRHFFDLRFFEKTGKPHPDMKQLATLMKEEAEKQGIWEDIMKQPSKFE